MIYRLSAAAALLIGTLALTACGGGGGSGIDVRTDGPLEREIPAADSVLISDMHVTHPDISPVRISDIDCMVSTLLCTASILEESYEFSLDVDLSGVSATVNVVNTNGDWEFMQAAARFERLQSGELSGLEARYAYVGGVKANSLPAQGSAIWRGDMVGLDANNRAVRGEAELTLEDWTDPRLDVTLTPQGRSVMTWEDLPVAAGRFSQQRRIDDYIRGEFYGRAATETGGVFERGGLVGAFGAAR
ncbi:MAG: hypothetical protein OXE84_02840 [Rhodobacteraceae bacterium]|nr:hypothetical protein [Paracoccaceae bacterium]MCY4326886.1 hypothetical protein [Paracoccaceae bacterium]